jgi:hypothetical protein
MVKGTETAARDGEPDGGEQKLTVDQNHQARGYRVARSETIAAVCVPLLPQVAAAAERDRCARFWLGLERRLQDQEAGR